MRRGRRCFLSPRCQTQDGPDECPPERTWISGSPSPVTGIFSCHRSSGRKSFAGTARAFTPPPKRWRREKSIFEVDSVSTEGPKTKAADWVRILKIACRRRLRTGREAGRGESAERSCARRRRESDGALRVVEFIRADTRSYIWVRTRKTEIVLRGRRSRLRFCRPRLGATGGQRASPAVSSEGRNAQSNSII